MDVKPHTALKHRILGVYFKICRKVMKKRKLCYVDLYAGDGESSCEDAPVTKWECPSLKSLLQRAKEENLKLNCFFNELNTESFKKLKDRTKEYPEFIHNITNKDANIICADILKQIPKKEWSIFFLDPFNHSELHWTTIENIAKHKEWDEYNNCMRQPELIINLMTYTMQRTTDPESITRALGTDEWKGKVKDITEEKIHEIYFEIFNKRLQELGYSTTYFQVKQTLPLTNVLYYLIIASSIPRANEIIMKNLKPYIDKIIAGKWAKENLKSRSVTKAKKKGYGSLEKWTT